MPKPASRPVRSSVASANSLDWCSATASAIRCWVATDSVPWRSSERMRVKARSAAGEPASTPTMFESWPPAVRAAFRMGWLRSGAVRSSWTRNLLSLVFIAASFCRSTRVLTGDTHGRGRVDLPFA